MASFAEAVRVFCPPPLPNNDPTKKPVTTTGLFVSGSEKAVPLRIRSVTSKVYCDTAFADTTETFAFIADEDVSVVFKFPLPPRSAVYKLEAVVGDRHITTEVKARQEAQQEFDQAVQQGHTAVIAKQEESSQIFTLELGNLAAMEEALVHVSYLRVLDSVGGALEFVHTSTWTPPYLGSEGDQKRGADHAAENNPRFASKVHYTLSYDVQLVSDRGFKAVESPEPITVKDKGKAKRVTMSEQVADPSKDLTLLVELEPLDSGAHATSDANGFADVSVQECDRAVAPPEGAAAEGADKATATRKKRVALATFVPRALMSAKADDAPPEPLNLELVLIVDCSGSMMGPRIEQARESALYFIKDLPANRAIKFNVVCFGSSHICWSDSGCKDFDELNMKSAVDWVQQNVLANLGGTEILNTFKAVYDMPVTQGFTRQIIFMTDGGISGPEEQAVYDLVQGGKGSGGEHHGGGISAGLFAGIQKLKDKVLGGGAHKEAEHHATDTAASAAAKTPAAAAVPAVHCLGIGYGVHRGLLDGIARRTGGVAQYVVDGEAISRKTTFLKKAALSGPSAIYAPRLTKSPGIIRAVPASLPPRLFPDEPLHVLVEVDVSNPPAKIEVTGKRGDGSPWSLAVPLGGVTATQGDAYAVLHGMVYVSGLLDGSSHLHIKEEDGALLEPAPEADVVKAEVTRAAIAEHLVTRHTAAVGVLLQKDPLDPSKVKKVEVPLATPHGAELFQQPGPQPGMMLFGAAGFPGAVLPRGMPMMAMAAPAHHQRKMMAAMPAMAPPPPTAYFSAQPGAPPGKLFAASAAPAPSVPFGSAPTAAAGSSGTFGSAPPPPVPNVKMANPGAFQMHIKPPAEPSIASLFGGPPPPPPPVIGGPVAVVGPDGQPIPGVTAAPAGAGTDFFAAFSGPTASADAAPPPPNVVRMANPGAFQMHIKPQKEPGLAELFGGGGGPAPPVLGGPVAVVGPDGQPVPGVTAAPAGAGGDFFAAFGGAQGLVADTLSGVPAPTAEEEAAKEEAEGGVDKAAPEPKTPKEVLDMLNLRRGLEGSWAASDEVLRAVTSQVGGKDEALRKAAVDAARAAKPADLSDEQWATVLSLAFLRKHCAAERSTWEGMEGKAMAWLAAGWPAGGKSVGITVLSALKVV